MEKVENVKLDLKDLAKEDTQLTILGYIENYLKIKNKDGVVMLFKLNKPQQRLYALIQKMKNEGRPVRIIILKARQLGFSTLVEGVIFAITATVPNMTAGIITHRDKATSNLFGMFKFFYDNLPNDIKPRVSSMNSEGVVFNAPNNMGMNSSISCMTATPRGVGRSGTFQLLHISEYAFWECDKKSTYSDLSQAVPSSPNSMIFIESTANGYDEFREFWYQTMSGENDFEAIFFAWFELDEYRKKYYGFELTPEEIELKKRFNLDNDQITWRRWAIANNCLQDVRKFKQEYPSTPEEAFQSSGNCIFDIEVLTSRLEEIKEPKTKGYLDYDYTFNNETNEMTVLNPRFIEDKQRGEIKIYESPIPNVPYVIGVDTAGEGSDYFVAQVIDNRNAKQVAIFRSRMDADLFIKQCMALGYYYNTALIIPEINYDPSCSKRLQTMGYPKLYLREVQDSITKEYQTKYGFRTTQITKPIIISRLIEYVRNNSNLINDIDTLNEMLQFVKIDDIEHKSSSMGAIKGAHDDCVMSLAIALEGYSSEQQSHFMELNGRQEKKKNWIEESYEKEDRRKSQWW